MQHFQLLLVFLLMDPFSLPAQTTLVGTVHSAADSSRLEGVNISVRDTIRAITDGEGHFRFSYAGRSPELRFSLLGYTPLTVTAGLEGVDSTDIAYGIDAIQQPTSMTCWATAATMLMNWKNSRSSRIEDALRAAGANLDPEDENYYVEMLHAALSEGGTNYAKQIAALFRIYMQTVNEAALGLGREARLELIYQTLANRVPNKIKAFNQMMRDSVQPDYEFDFAEANEVLPCINPDFNMALLDGPDGVRVTPLRMWVHDDAAPPSPNVSML